jgi:tetratricopeptide (TPR) repeat protein
MRLRLAAATAFLLCAASAHAQTLRPEVGKPLAAARAAAAAHNFAKANAALRQAEAAGGKTPAENMKIAQMRAYIAQQSGDTADAARAYEQLLNSGALPPGETAAVMKDEIGFAYAQKNYPEVVKWAERYLKINPSDTAIRTTLIQGYYLQGNYAQAEKLQLQQIALETRGGRAPAEDQLQLLYSCQSHLNDKAGQATTIRQLIYYFPNSPHRSDYWLNAIDTLRTTPGFSDRLMLDVYRLEWSLGLVNKASDAMEYAELALQAKLGGEAKDVVDKSFASGLMGTGADAPRQDRLRKLVDATYASEKAALGKEDADAATDRDGNRLCALGETYVSFGDTGQGISLLEQGLRKDQLRHADDEKLHLAYAYVLAGQKSKAIATLKSVGGNEGTSALATLWLIHIGR